MNASDTSSLTSQNPALQQGWTQQQGFELVPERRQDQVNHQREPLEPWSQQFEQEDVKPEMSFAAFGSGDGLFAHLPPSCQVSDTVASSSNYLASQPNSHSSSQNTTSQSSNPHLSGDSSAMDLYPSGPMPLLRDRKSGRAAKGQNTSAYRRHGSVTPPPGEAPHAMRHDSDFVRSTSTGMTMCGEGLHPSTTDAGLLREIYDTTQCFWLVSENRMNVMQEELKVIKARIEDSVLVQERLITQGAQISQLQVQITQKMICAAEDRKIIFGRIKSLEESNTVWHREFKAVLEATRAEFRAAMEVMLDIAPKARKPQIQRAMDEAAGEKTNKRTSPLSKKSNLPKAKKGKIQVVEVEDRVEKTPALSLDSSPSSKPDPSSIDDLLQPQTPRNDQLHPSHEQLHHQPRSHSASQKNPDGHAQAHPRHQTAEPSLHHSFRRPGPQSNARHQTPYEYPRPQFHPTKPYMHDIQPGISSMEVGLHG